MENQKTSIIKEFYNTVAYLLKYESSAKTVDRERSVLSLICDFYESPSLFEDCWKSVDEARSLQVCSDESLLKNSCTCEHSATWDLKMDVLLKHSIERTKYFNRYVFERELKEAADFGETDACKLLACLNWMGVIFPVNKTVALNIWSNLAINGDWEAIRAVIYAYDAQENESESTRWRHILGILRDEYEAFAPVALCSKHKECTVDEVQLANLILFIRQKNARGGGKNIDRSMLHYVLVSNESFEYKMERLSSDTNYNLVMALEDRFMGKKYGF
jgi:hypothetical protein